MWPFIPFWPRRPRMLSGSRSGGPSSTCGSISSIGFLRRYLLASRANCASAESASVVDMWRIGSARRRRSCRTLSQMNRGRGSTAPATWPATVSTARSNTWDAWTIRSRCADSVSSWVKSNPVSPIKTRSAKRRSSSAKIVRERDGWPRMSCRRTASRSTANDCARRFRHSSPSTWCRRSS